MKKSRRRLVLPRGFHLAKQSAEDRREEFQREMELRKLQETRRCGGGRQILRKKIGDV